MPRPRQRWPLPCVPSSRYGPTTTTASASCGSLSTHSRGTRRTRPTARSSSCSVLCSPCSRNGNGADQLPEVAARALDVARTARRPAGAAAHALDVGLGRDDGRPLRRCDALRSHAAADPRAQLGDEAGRACAPRPSAGSCSATSAGPPRPTRSLAARVEQSSDLRADAVARASGSRRAPRVSSTSARAGRGGGPARRGTRPGDGDPRRARHGPLPSRPRPRAPARSVTSARAAAELAAARSELDPRAPVR